MIYDLRIKKPIFLFIFLVFLFAISFLAVPVHVMSSSSMDPWMVIDQKLSVVPNTFALHRNTSLIPQAYAAEGYEQAKSYIAVDMANGTIISEKNSSTPLPIASLTKIMSAVVGLDLAKPTQEITISTLASEMPPTKIGVVPGQKMTVEELLHAMLMTSANDAAQALADGINSEYGKNVFVAAMNEKAHLLGLSQTHFTSPQGFDFGNNESSAHDLAILSSYALSHYSLITDIVNTTYQELPASTFHKQFDLYNWNGLLGVYPGASGMKIGNTAKAGFASIVTANRQGHSVLVVILGASGVLQRDLWAASLLDDTFASFGIAPVQIDSTELLAKYATWQYWQ